MSIKICFCGEGEQEHAVGASQEERQFKSFRSKVLTVLFSA